MTEDWRSAADAAARRRRGAWTATFLYFVAGGGLWGAAIALEGTARLVCLALGAVAIAAGSIYGTAIYMARVDEQERMANLWGAYVAICVYLALFGLSWMFKLLAISVPLADILIFAAVMLSFGVTFLWQRFR